MGMERHGIITAARNKPASLTSVLGYSQYKNNNFRYSCHYHKHRMQILLWKGEYFHPSCKKRTKWLTQHHRRNLRESLKQRLTFRTVLRTPLLCVTLGVPRDTFATAKNRVRPPWVAGLVLMSLDSVELSTGAPCSPHLLHEQPQNHPDSCFPPLCAQLSLFSANYTAVNPPAMEQQRARSQDRVPFPVKASRQATGL